MIARPPGRRAQSQPETAVIERIFKASSAAAGFLSSGSARRVIGCRCTVERAYLPSRQIERRMNCSRRRFKDCHETGQCEAQNESVSCRGFQTRRCGDMRGGRTGRVGPPEECSEQIYGNGRQPESGSVGHGKCGECDPSVARLVHVELRQTLNKYQQRFTSRRRVLVDDGGGVLIAGGTATCLFCVYFAD
jgi:hypothetical protein